MRVGVNWIRTNGGLPTDLQSAALTTQPLLPAIFTLIYLSYIVMYLQLLQPV